MKKSRKVVRLDLSENYRVLEQLNEIVDDIGEICVIYSTKEGIRRIVHGRIDDPLEWYGVVVGLAHNMFLHDEGEPLSEE